MTTTHTSGAADLPEALHRVIDDFERRERPPPMGGCATLGDCGDQSRTCCVMRVRRLVLRVSAMFTWPSVGLIGVT